MSYKILTVGAVPDRKQKALSVTTYHDGHGATTKVLGYFRSEEAYREFLGLADARTLVRARGAG